jgi:hypothetical protein
VCALVGCFVVLEIFARRYEALIAAVAHRVAFKVAMFERQPETQLLFVGTSRFNDGISPRAVTSALGAGWRGFNASTPGSSLEALAYVVQKTAHRDGLRLVLAELSDRQIAVDNEFTVDALPAFTDDAHDAEAWLATRAQARSALLKHRRAWVLENLPRWGGLLAAPWFDGSEWFRTNSLVEWLRPASEAPSKPWTPAPIARALPVEAANAHSAAAYAALAAEVMGAGRGIVFVTPPVAAKQRAASCSVTLRALAAEIVERSGAEVWDFACAETSDEFFHDGVEHLNERGRQAFSAAIAAGVANWLGSKGARAVQ